MYYGWDTDPGMEQEALEQERFEADLLQAQYEAEGRRITRARRAGRCTHGSAVGYRNPTCYPEQEGLEPGQLRCTDGCGQVFGSDDDWADARAAAVRDF